MFRTFLFRKIWSLHVHHRQAHYKPARIVGLLLTTPGDNVDVAKHAVSVYIDRQLSPADDTQRPAVYSVMVDWAWVTQRHAGPSAHLITGIQVMRLTYHAHPH